MKRKIIGALLIAVSAISLISCGGSKSKEDISSKSEEVTEEASNAESKETNGKAEEKKKEDAKEEKGKSEKTQNLNKKSEYKKNLDDIEKGLSDLESYRAGTTADMKYAAGEEYKRWDRALNEIYSDLKENLSKEEMNKLEAEETKWIKDKEEKAKEAGKIYEGGTAEGLAYTSSLAETTKSRCYELVDKYMK